jgi:hypothetical protein
MNRKYIISSINSFKTIRNFNGESCPIFDSPAVIEEQGRRTRRQGESKCDENLN